MFNVFYGLCTRKGLFSWIINLYACLFSISSIECLVGFVASMFDCGYGGSGFDSRARLTCCFFSNKPGVGSLTVFHPHENARKAIGPAPDLSQVVPN